MFSNPVIKQILKPREVTNVFKYGRMQKRVLSWLVWLPWCMPILHVTWHGVQVTTGLGFFAFNCNKCYIYVIAKIVTPCINRLRLLSRFLVEQCTENISCYTIIALANNVLLCLSQFFVQIKCSEYIAIFNLTIPRYVYYDCLLLLFNKSAEVFQSC